MSPRFAVLAVLAMFMSCASVAQIIMPKTSSASSPVFTVDNDFVQKEFGSTCTLIAGPPVLTGDLDGDGIEDAVIVAKCKNALVDQGENNFTVIDPYYSFFGYGNTRITTQFASEVPEDRGISLLVIHGAGPDAWHSATPKAKFVVINMPFKQIGLKKMVMKKKSVLALYIEETGADQMTSALFWDGKKYRYVPIGASME
jgi:hypothetical protein